MDTEEQWQEQSPESKQESIIEELTLIEVQVIDPELVSKYSEEKARTSDQADLMRIDLAFSAKLRKLREEGKVSPVSKLREKAESMVKMNADELRKAFHDYSSELTTSADNSS